MEMRVLEGTKVFINGEQILFGQGQPFQTKGVSMNIFVRVLYILLALAFVVLAYYVVIWVLGMLGIAVPDQILKVVFVILALLAVIGVLTGKIDTWFGHS